jgi:hypothetical protein
MPVQESVGRAKRFPLALPQLGFVRSVTRGHATRFDGAQRIAKSRERSYGDDGYAKIETACVPAA